LLGWPINRPNKNCLECSICIRTICKLCCSCQELKLPPICRFRRNQTDLDFVSETSWKQLLRAGREADADAVQISVVTN
jgi:hypothetical protein